MKNLLFLSLLAILLGCNQPEPQAPETAVQPLSQSCQDTIYKGFRLGMTSAEYESHANKLRQQKELRKRGEYYLSAMYVKSLPDSFETILLPTYHQDSLYKLMLAVQPYNNIFTVELLQTSFAIPYSRKYGVSKKSAPLGSLIYTWIDSCSTIEIRQGIDHVQIEYLDNYYQNLLDAERQQEEQQQLQKLQEDI